MAATAPAAARGRSRLRGLARLGQYAGFLPALGLFGLFFALPLGLIVAYSFWETIDRVDVNQTQADASARRAVVNLTFRKKDGGTSTERHQLTFATDDRGDYRIDSDHLLR